jgi:hypothetical protein
MLAVSPGECLQPGRRSGDMSLGGHECRAPKYAGIAEELVSGWWLRLRDENLQSVQTLTSLQGEEVGAPQWVGH